MTNRRHKLNRRFPTGGLSVLLLSALVFVLIPTIAEADFTLHVTPGDGKLQAEFSEEPNVLTDNSYDFLYYDVTPPTTWTFVNASNTTKTNCQNLGGTEICTFYLIVDGLTNGTLYTLEMRARGTANTIRTVRPRASPAAPTELMATAADDGEVTLTWTDPSNTEIDKYQIRYRRSDETFDDDEAGWDDIDPSDATTTSHTVTGLYGGVEYIFELRAVDTGLISADQASAAASMTGTTTGTPPPPPRPPAPPPPPPPAPPPRNIVVVHECPIGWQSQNAVGDPTPRVFIRTVEVDIDDNSLAGVYTATAIEIYADPEDARTDLDGWTLRLRIPYNVVGIDYPLTAENSVLDAEGVLRIESTEVTPFLTTDLGVSGGPLPGFDYRLFDEKNRHIDSAIACYRGLNTFSQLQAMGAPRVERTVDITDLVWEEVVFLRSEWRVPVSVPAAPSVPRRLTTLWGSLKKQ